MKVAGRRIASQQDGEYIVDRVQQMLRVVDARIRFASIENRREVDSLFRRAQNEFRTFADAK